jgi:hypothetical protein
VKVDESANTPERDSDYQRAEPHITTLYALRKSCGLHGEVFLASEQDPEGWSADIFTVVLESAGLNAT